MYTCDCKGNKDEIEDERGEAMSGGYDRAIEQDE